MGAILLGCELILPKRILVVDDDVHVREMLVQRLRQRGHTVDAAGNATGAFQHLAGSDYDVLVVDLLLEREANTTLVDQLLGGSRVPRCIVMSGVADLWRRAHPDAPVVGVLQKPFEFAELVRLIDSV